MFQPAFDIMKMFLYPRHCEFGSYIGLVGNLSPFLWHCSIQTIFNVVTCSMFVVSHEIEISVRSRVDSKPV